MRSRTEMVTTTFVDSEEDYSDDDDSEEDWRPSASNKNGKKQKQSKHGTIGQSKRGRKRKSSSAKTNKNTKRKATYENSDDDDDDEEDDLSEDDYECEDLEEISGSSRKPSNLPLKKQFSEKNSSTSGNDDMSGDTFNLLVYVKDLSGTDINKNNRLCLWRKDKNNLLQKYIRVKTSSEEFIFTSSSVYSRFDEKRFSDFYDIKVKFIDSSNRRVKIVNPSELQKLYLRVAKNENNSDDDTLSDDKSDKKNCVKFMENSKSKSKHVPKYNTEDDDDDEEEVEEENDEEEEDCNLEGDDDDEIEEDDEADDE
ncbi:uncharacterized protein ACRADG_005489 isoform 1-T3 [Cochliomyia hominivorax]